MYLQQLVEALDARILAGDIIGAFEEFFAEDVVTHSGPKDITYGKIQKLEGLRWFFNNVVKANRITLLSQGIGDDVTHSEFIFDFTNQMGEHMVWNEVIRRIWKDGKVVDEKYYTAHLANDYKTADKGEQVSIPAAANTTASKATKPAAVAKTPKAAPSNSGKQAATKKDDLTLIEGIGPKIAEILHKSGISTFTELAKTKPATLRTKLEAAGKRFQMHDPATWPEQAMLARDGKTDELAKLQDALKGGRK